MCFPIHLQTCNIHQVYKHSSHGTVVFNDDYLQWQVGKLSAYRYAFKLYRLIFWGAHHHYPCQPSLSLDHHHTIASTFINTTMNIVFTTTFIIMTYSISMVRMMVRISTIIINISTKDIHYHSLDLHSHHHYHHHHHHHHHVTTTIMSPSSHHHHHHYLHHHYLHHL